MIGYLGPVGTFTEQACHVFREAQGIPREEALAFDDSEALFQALGQSCTYIVVPIENSVEGMVNISLDLLIHGEGPSIVAEVVLPIEQALLAKPGASIKTITDIWSHPQAIAQCRKFIRESFSHSIRLHYTASTASAAQEISERTGPTDAAIGPKTLADLYPLEILATKIHDQENNQTRFWVLSSTKRQEKSGDDKTAIVFSCKKDKPGALMEVLAEFANRNINLTQIASRPTKEVLGDYLFFVDFLGHVADAVIAEALAAIQPKTSYYKWLGSFRKAVL